MHKVVVLFLLIALTTFQASCSALTPPEPLYPALNERPVAGPGRLDEPKWSPDGKYIAFINGDQQVINVYEVETRRISTIGVGSYSRNFAWGPENQLTYMNYRPDLSGSPFPEVFDLHRSNPDGTNDQVVLSRLYSPKAYRWLPNGQYLVGILAAHSSQDGLGDIYLVDVTTGESNRLLSRRDLNVDRALTLALSEDGERLAIRGIRQSSGENISVLVVYDFKSKSITKQIIPSERFPSLMMGDSDVQWVGDGHQWLLFEGSVPAGECYKNAVFFLNPENPGLDFCIPTAGAPAKDPGLSPDASRFTFTTFADGILRYVMLADMPPKYQSKLKP
jgi:WD40 repeat protein